MGERVKLHLYLSCSPLFTLPPELNHLVAGKQAQDSLWFCISELCNYFIIYHSVIIIEIKCTVNVIFLNHPEAMPPSQPMEKLSSRKLVPGAKRLVMKVEPSWWDQCSYKRDLRELPHPSPIWGHSKKTAVYEPEGVLSPDSESAITLKSRLPRLQNCGK